MTHDRTVETLTWRENSRVVSHLAVELATALLVAGCFLHFGFSGRTFVGAFFIAVLVVLAVIDVERRILPNRIVLPSTLVVLAAQTALFPDRALEWTAASLGAALGRYVTVGLMVGMVAAAVVAVVLVAHHGTAARKTAIPFGPFLALGSVVALFWGEAILEAYLGRF